MEDEDDEIEETETLGETDAAADATEEAAWQRVSSTSDSRTKKQQRA